MRFSWDPPAPAEVERNFAEERSKSPIGPRFEERVIPLGATQGLYFADYASGTSRVRFRIGFDPAGLMPLVEPVEPLPPDPRGHPAGHGAPATSVRRPVVGHRGSHAGDREPPRGGF